MTSKQRSLQDTFNSIFHDQMSFEEFLTLDISKEYRIVSRKKRTVFVPSNRLKKIHRFLNQVILQHVSFNENVVYSYRKKYTARDAIVKHAKSNIFFKTDIHNFFGNIQKQNVQNILDSRLYDVPLTDIEQYKENIAKLVVVDNQLPAGFATSPLLSNICLQDFDNALENYCSENNLIYTRYSDDLIVSGNEQEFTSQILGEVSQLLNEKVNPIISLNPSKTKIYKKGQNFKIMGFIILPNGIVTIPSADKKYIESMLYFFLTDQDKFTDTYKGNRNSKHIQSEQRSLRELAIASLSGKIIALNSMDKNYVVKLRSKYGNTLIDMFLRKSVK